MKKYKVPLSITLLFSLVTFALIGKSLFDHEKYTKYFSEQKLENNIDSYMINAKAQAYNNQGMLRWRAKASHWEHNTYQQYTKMKNPELELFDSTANHWDLKGEAGTIFHGKDASDVKKISLESNVIIAYAPKNQFNQFKGYTQFANYFPKTNNVVAPLKVKLIHLNNETQTMGLHANIASGKMTLDSRVMSKYEKLHS